MIKRLLVVAFVFTFNVCTAYAADDFSAIRSTLQRIVKDIPLDSIKATSIDGLYEVQSHYDIIYFYPKGEIFFLGQLHSSDGKSITAAARDKVVERTVASLDLSKAIRSGSGKNVVIEFIDPDCDICRSTDEYWKSKSGVTRFSFLFPASTDNPEGTRKSEWVLSQKDKAAAFDEVLSGKYDQAVPEGVTEEGRNLFKEHLRNAEKAYVTGVPLFIVNNRLFLRPDIEAFEGALVEGALQAGVK